MFQLFNLFHVLMQFRNHLSQSRLSAWYGSLCPSPHILIIWLMGFVFLDICHANPSFHLIPTSFPTRFEFRFTFSLTLYLPFCCRFFAVCFHELLFFQSPLATFHHFLLPGDPFLWRRLGIRWAGRCETQFGRSVVFPKAYVRTSPESSVSPFLYADNPSDTLQDQEHNSPHNYNDGNSIIATCTPFIFNQMKSHAYLYRVYISDKWPHSLADLHKALTTMR